MRESLPTIYGTTREYNDSQQKMHGFILWNIHYIYYLLQIHIIMNRNTFFVLFLLISNLVSGQDLKLWYSQPAQNWSEALPIGNSRLGAMVYGGIEREELQLNEETFWAGSPYNNNNPNAVHVLPVVRKLIFEGRNKEAQRLIDANFLTRQHGICLLYTSDAADE